VTLSYLIYPGVVFEDAPAGVLSGRAAGCKTIGLLTTHSREQMEAAQPDVLVQDLSRFGPPLIISYVVHLTCFQYHCRSQRIQGLGNYGPRGLG
jgi:hypothetical protein